MDGSTQTPESAPTKRRQQLLDYLSARAADPDIRIFAVMDGAFFENLDADLRDAGITRRPLYRYSGNYSVVLGGPWMVDPYHHDRHFMEETAGDIAPDDLPVIQARLKSIFEIAGDKAGLVFWIGDASLTPEALYSHLRKLNKVLIPKTPDSADEGGELAEAADIGESDPPPDYELVLFRHADANVMAQVLPALDKPQSARLLGPCREILFVPDEEWGGNIRRLSHPGEDVKAPSGPLRWEPETMRAISERRMEGSRRKVMAYLREVDPGGTEGLSDAELYRRIRSYEASGNELGLRSERAHMKWSYLMSITEGGANQDGVAKSYFRSSSKHPDDAIDDILDALDDAVGDRWDSLWRGGALR
jgi:hypothetical protein